jgi:hypothetical protein
MHLHREALAADQMLARTMEVELHQPIVAAIPDREHAAVAHIHLNRVAIVHDRIGVLGPGDIQAQAAL